MHTVCEGACEAEQRAKKGKYIETRGREKVTKLGNCNGRNMMIKEKMRMQAWACAFWLSFKPDLSYLLLH